MVKRSRTIELTENRLRGIITECVRTILLESQESKSQHEAKRYLMDKGYNKEDADDIVRIRVRSLIPALKDENIAKFTRGVVRMWYEGEIRNANNASNLNATLKLMGPYLNDYERDLSDKTSKELVSCQELISRFEPIRQAKLETEKTEINSMSFGDSDYDIVRIDTFEDARRYANYTKWCITHDKSAFDTYTLDGNNQIYFCLRHGLENVRYKVGNDAPLDEYGLSMISVIVNEKGELVSCTSRWNHDNGGNDDVMSAKEISQVVGVNFYNTFKPNEKWEDKLSVVSERLSNGEPFDEVFDECIKANIDGLFIVRLCRRWTYVKSDGSYLTNDWFNECNRFKEGFAVVEKNSKYTYLKTDGTYLRNELFDRCYDFSGGFGRVKKNGKYTYLKTDGDYLTNDWFDGCNFFIEGFAVVKKNSKYTYLKTDGTYLINDWFDWCDIFIEGFAVVKKNGKYTYLKTDGTYLINDWFDKCRNFNDGFGIVEMKGRKFNIDKNGVLTPLNQQ